MLTTTRITRLATVALAVTAIAAPTATARPIGETHPIGLDTETAATHATAGGIDIGSAGVGGAIALLSLGGAALTVRLRARAAS
jgi:hypothetical protein